MGTSRTITLLCAVLASVACTGTVSSTVDDDAVDRDAADNDAADNDGSDDDAPDNDPAGDDDGNNGGVTVRVTPASLSLATSGTHAFTCTVTGAANGGCTWSVQEPSGGSVSSSGLYSAPGAAGSYHVVATSVADATKHASATVNVIVPGTTLELTPGVWTNISPPGITDFGTITVEIDPTDPSTIYTVGGANRGAWVSHDGGQIWEQLGDSSFNYNGGLYTEYLDGPSNLRVDPADSQHLYATQGVRGATMGFWISTDGGETWSIPQSLIDTNTTRDLTTLAVDPNDFDHVLVGSHSMWTALGSNSSGLLESKDGGATWIVHMPLPDWTSRENFGIAFLDDVEGSEPGQTWLVSTETFGYWRTTNGGDDWSKVSNASGAHGTPQTYRAHNGVYYCATSSRIVRSTDNGASWQTLGDSSGLPGWYYAGIVGDGNFIYTAPTFANTEPTGSGLGQQPFFVTSESDGLTWTTYNPSGTGAQTFNNGPNFMLFDTVNRIVYSAQWGFGLWALAVVDP